MQRHSKLQRLPCGLLAVTWILPVATYLHIIHLTKESLLCTQYGQGGGQKESISHFFSRNLLGKSKHFLRFVLYSTFVRDIRVKPDRV